MSEEKTIVKIDVIPKAFRIIMELAVRLQDLNDLSEPLGYVLVIRQALRILRVFLIDFESVSRVRVYSAAGDLREDRKVHKFLAMPFQSPPFFWRVFVGLSKVMPRWLRKKLIKKHRLSIPFSEEVLQLMSDMARTMQQLNELERTPDNVKVIQLGLNTLARLLLKREPTDLIALIDFEGKEIGRFPVGEFAKLRYQI